MHPRPSPAIDGTRTSSPQASTVTLRLAETDDGQLHEETEARRAENLGAPPQTPALLGDEPGHANQGEWLRSCAVISPPATTRDTRPAAPGQAVLCGQDNQRTRKVTGPHVHANDGLPRHVRPGMASPARRGDDHNFPCCGLEERRVHAASFGASSPRVSGWMPTTSAIFLSGVVFP